MQFTPPQEAQAHGRGGVWQLAAKIMRMSVGDGEGGIFRPVMATIVDRESGFCYAMDLAKKGDAPFEAARRLLVQTISKQGVPQQVQVSDPELATALRGGEELKAVAVEVVRQLDTLDEIMAMMEKDMMPAGPSLLEGAGVSVERLRAFAAGAAVFHRAAPWRELHDEDVIEIESPRPPKGLRCASVLGAAGQVMGIGFFADEADYERMFNDASNSYQKATGKRRWSLMFNPAEDVSPGDADAWQEHGLAVTPDDEIPVLLRAGSKGKIDRPDGATMTFVEGLCRAIAASSGEDLDRGRWEKSVTTFDGEIVYRLAIPHLLKPPPARPPAGRASMEQSMRQLARMVEESGAKSIDEMNAFLQTVIGRPLPDSAPASDAERALDLCVQAESSRARRALQLIREALKLDPDCAEAHVLLARRESDPAAAEAIYRLAVQAGRKTLGEEAFNQPGYPFWGALASRPFMRAMAGLADVLQMQGRAADATQVLSEMLKLNPGDNQGMRYRYVPLLIEQRRLEEARGVLDSRHYRDDACALWDYAAALVAFMEGRRADADRRLTRALKRNAMAGRLLLELRDPPVEMPDSWSPGSSSEAIIVADALLTSWRADGAALQWLRDATKATRSASPSPPAKLSPARMARKRDKREGKRRR